MQAVRRKDYCHRS